MPQRGTILPRVWRPLRCRGAVAAGMLALMLFVVAGPAWAQPAQQILQDARNEAGLVDELTIGPGKVRLTMTRAGRWIGLMPEWENGTSLITGGGFVVTAVDEEGKTVELSNTSRGPLSVRDTSRRLAKCCEGMPGGFRSPSPNPDDDGDGAIDEDRLDGRDNDGDGAIDEDFAAIGDEMVVTEYVHESGNVRLVFHQEAYAWSLPHIDGTIMLSLRMWNAGRQPLHGVRIAAFLEKDGPLRFSSQAIEREGGEGVSGRAFVASGAAGSSVALVGFPSVGNEGRRWTGGYGESIVALIRHIDRANRPDEETKQPLVIPFGLLPPHVVMPGETTVEGNLVVYMVSPPVERLDPGQEMRIDLALIAHPQNGRVADAVNKAYKTFVGDGVNRYLPPPVSMKARVVWGTFRRLDKHKEEAGGGSAVVVEFDEHATKWMGSNRISFIAGVEPEAVERRTTPRGMVQLVIRGEAAERLLAQNKRMTLKGRMAGGEFFEAILKPYNADRGTLIFSSREAELFWKTPGKLTEDLLRGSPNPFRDATTVYYEIPSIIEQEDGSQLIATAPLRTSVKVYNVTGRLVKILVDDIIMPGTYSAGWTATDDNGSLVASGVYYVKLQIEKRHVTKRLILLK